MNNDLGGLLFNTQKRPNRNSGTDPIAKSGDFDPFTDNYFNRDAWSDPGPLQFGNAPQRDPDVRGFATYGEDINIFKVFRVGRGEEPALRGAVRQYLQPRRLLRSEPELELTGVRRGQHTVQHAAGREFWIPIRLLTDNRTIRTPPLQKDPKVFRGAEPFWDETLWARAAAPSVPQARRAMAARDRRHLSNQLLPPHIAALRPSDPGSAAVALRSADEQGAASTSTR